VEQSINKERLYIMPPQYYYLRVLWFRADQARSPAPLDRVKDPDFRYNQVQIETSFRKNHLVRAQVLTGSRLADLPLLPTSLRALVAAH